MAAHVLIEQHLAQLGRRLPREAVDELADGLAATYEHHLDSGMDPQAAAVAAIEEFGRPGEIVAAFVRQAPGRRTALVLLLTGPVMAACWGPSLILAQAWTWPLPRLLAVAGGIGLLLVVALLAVAATSRTSYRRADVARLGAGGLVLLDAAFVAAVVIAAPAMVWPMLAAIAASLTRAALTTRALIVARA
ncbi:permease prefix domain 1-containing protein [Kribbella sp. NPDC002412]